MISSHNPFRTPGVTPQPTGASAHSTANPFGSDEPLPPHHLPASSLSSPESHNQLNAPSFPTPSFPTPSVSSRPTFAGSSFGPPSGAPPPHFRRSSPAPSDSSSEGEQREDLPELRFPELTLDDIDPPTATSPPRLPPRIDTFSHPTGPPPLPIRSPTGPTPPTLPPRRDSFGPPSGPPPPSTRSGAFSPPPSSPSSFRPPSGPPPPSQSFSPPPHPPPSSSQSFSSPPGPPPRAPARVDSLGPPPGSPPPSITQLPPAAPRPLTPPPEIDEELPAYSATPDATHGEESIDFGPRRPFQRPPPEGQHPLAQQPQPRAAQRHNFSGPIVPPPTARQQNLAPPSQPSPRARSVSPSHSTRPLSDFARDFYAAGGDPSGATLPPSSPAASASTSAQPRYAPPPGPPPTTASHLQPNLARYAPPPGPPPALRRTTSNVGPASSSSGVGGAGAGLSRSVSANHGQPTTSPTPGHPLLNNGQTLVYPEGYVCTKCHNTGYKNYDPSHPCRRCWERYARPFTAAFARLWSSNSENNTQAHNQQRPLPNFSSPRGASGTPSPSTSTSTAHRRASSASTLNTHGAVQPPLARSTTSATARSNAPALAGQGQGQRPPPRTVAISSVGRAPSGATVVKPGDPRIGGRLCWRCDGRGWHSFLLFDEVTCEVCNGLGRTGVQAR